VAIGYFDASALVKLLVEEPGSELAARVWDESDAVATSLISYPEVAAALAAAKRAGRLTAAGARRARSDWDSYWAGCRVVEVTSEIAATAAALVDAQVLGGADAIHLASARLFGAEAVMVAWDRRLHTAARAFGLVVCPPEIGPTVS
jgi:predicted nucleic acid-binding protein